MLVVRQNNSNSRQIQQTLDKQNTSDGCKFSLNLNFKLPYFLKYSSIGLYFRVELYFRKNGDFLN
jgi:hypothetical protein